LSMADWQSPSPAPPREPAIKAGGIATAGGTGVFLGKKTNGGYEFLETSTAEECFLELGGWKPADGYADLDRVADLYQTDLELNASQFWYHAEFFDAVRLRLLFDFVHDQGGPDLMQLFAAHLGEPAVLIDPALICYYLFFPGHEEGLAGCDGVAEARNYANFAGEWACVAVLLDRDLSGGAYSPKQVGLTRRDVGIIKFRGGEVRSSMRIFSWSAMQPSATHPRLIVARGSHDLYLPGEVPKPLEPLTAVDPSAGSCGLAELPAGQIVGSKNPFPVAAVFPYPKLIAGAAAGYIFGPFGNALGALARTIWTIAEMVESSGETFGYESSPPSLSPTGDFVSTAGKVVHPVGLRPAEVDPARAVEWRCTDDLTLAGIVDRDTQILGPGDPEPRFKGYTGRWGPRVAGDPDTRRAGMCFPNFSHMLFDSLVRGKQPFTIVFLTTGTTWTVPADWNKSKNTIECIGGGGVDGSVAVAGAGGSGGGGAYSMIANLALTPGTQVNYQVGTGGARADAAAGSGGDTYFNGTSLAACSVGAKGGDGANGTVGGAGGAADGGVGTSKFAGGNGADGGEGFVGGPSGGGAASPKGAGANGGAATVDQEGGGGGGGNGDGSAAATGATGTIGNKGGNNAGGAGGGAGGVEFQPENPDAAQTAGGAGTGVGGGGGGGGSATASGTCGVGGVGGTGMDFDATHASGGGGGGSGIQATGGDGGAGGLYGGGGGGGYVGSGTGGQGGKGADGLIVITYVP
jgi:hypothetical protein